MKFCVRVCHIIVDFCLALYLNEIVEILSKMFPNEQKTKVFFEHALDPSGNSFIYEKKPCDRIL